jgi:hypothetical protein
MIKGQLNENSCVHVLMLLQQKAAGEYHRSCKGGAETGARGHAQERRRRQEASHPGTVPKNLLEGKPET